MNIEHKNFLPTDQFNELKNLVCDIDFPWRIREKMANTDKGRPKPMLNTKK